MNTPEIDSILARIAQGDRKAFRQLVELFQDEIHQFLRYFLGSPQEAEDVTQEVFLEVFKSIHSFRGNASLKTWIFSVAKHVGCRWWREKKREDLIRHPMGSENDEWEGIPDFSTNPEKAFDTLEEREKVAQAMEALPDLYKTILFLHVWEELRYADISRILEIPLGTVKSRIHNGLARLGTSLRGLLEGREP